MNEMKRTNEKRDRVRRLFQDESIGWIYESVLEIYLSLSIIFVIEVKRIDVKRHSREYRNMRETYTRTQNALNGFAGKFHAAQARCRSNNRTSVSRFAIETRRADLKRSRSGINAAVSRAANH